MLFQNVPTDGSSVGTQKANFGTTHPYLGTVALIDGTTPLAVFDSGSSMAVFRRYTGSGNLNDPASWTPPQDIGYADYPRLAAGPSGVFLLSTDSPTGTCRSAATSATPASGRPPRSGRRPASRAQDYMTQDPGGQLHVLLPQITADGSRLMHATLNDGTTWTQTQHAFEPLALQTSAAVAADHTGVAVWESASNPPIINVMAISGGAAARCSAAPVTARVVRGTVLVGPRARRPSAAGARRAADVPNGHRVRAAARRGAPSRSARSSTRKRGTVELRQRATGRGARPSPASSAPASSRCSSRASAARRA